jgi:hypothetical protein
MYLMPKVLQFSAVAGYLFEIVVGFVDSHYIQEGGKTLNVRRYFPFYPQLQEYLLHNFLCNSFRFGFFKYALNGNWPAKPTGRM